MLIYVRRKGAAPQRVSESVYVESIFIYVLVSAALVVSQVPQVNKTLPIVSWNCLRPHPILLLAPPT